MLSTTEIYSNTCPHCCNWDHSIWKWFSRSSQFNQNHTANDHKNKTKPHNHLTPSSLALSLPHPSYPQFTRHITALEAVSYVAQTTVIFRQRYNRGISTMQAFSFSWHFVCTIYITTNYCKSNPLFYFYFLLLHNFAKVLLWKVTDDELKFSVRNHCMWTIKAWWDMSA